MNYNGCPVTEDYLSTAAHIFESCPLEANGLLPVNIIIENLSSLIKTETGCNYKRLILLLDPDDVNPSITVKHLADALEMFSLHHSHNQSDLDESFNLISRNTRSFDSNSGNNLAEELKENAHPLSRMRAQLDIAEIQLEQSLSNDQLNVSREENATLSSLRKEFEEWRERAAAVKSALAAASAGRERKYKAARSALDELENKWLRLQGQVSKSSAECQRIINLYATRQARHVFEENKRLTADFADMSIRYPDQVDFLQKAVGEKVLQEMEMKGLLNKSPRQEGKVDTSVKSSYSGQQILQTVQTDAWSNLASVKKDAPVGPQP